MIMLLPGVFDRRVQGSDPDGYAEDGTGRSFSSGQLLGRGARCGCGAPVDGVTAPVLPGALLVLIPDDARWLAADGRRRLADQAAAGEVVDRGAV